MQDLLLVEVAECVGKLLGYAEDYVFWESAQTTLSFTVITILNRRLRLLGICQRMSF